MKKRLLSVLLCLCLVLALLPTLALAAATGIQVTDATYHANGNLASITAKFGWSTAAANSRLVLMTEKLNDGDLTNQGTYGDDFREWTDVEAAKSTLGIISMSDVASVSGAQNSLSISFGENDIPLNTDKTYYVYLWTRWGQWSGDESCYPDNLISVIKVEGGTVQYTGATGSNSHGDSYQEVPYTVTFDLQGHGTAISEQTVVKGGKVTAPTAPTDSDYDFGGWFKEAACTTAWNFDTDTVTATTTLYAKWTETPKALEEVTFGYAYDVQRNPSFPDGVGDTVTLSSLSRPLLAGGRDDRKDTNEGTWTLTKMGTYSYVKTLGGTVFFTSEIASKYGVTADEIVIHELKDGTDHIAYGVVIVYDAENGYAVFIGNNISGSGAGYLLSTEAKSENFTITADQIATDFIPTCELALDTTGTYTFTAAADKTVTASNSGTAATGALTVALSGTDAASFELNKTAIADIATGGSDTFTVAPKSGLAAGTYTATVTVSGANVVAKSFDVTYTVSAPATPVTLLNDGYPYGKAMSSSSVTLVMDVSGTASSYQWQSADAKDGTYTDIADANAKELVLSSPTSGTWYRCVVNGALTSKAVQVVKPNTSGPDVNGNKWTASYGTYYISNGTVAYMVSCSQFDVAGLYVKNSTSYMVQTSYSENWQMFSSTQAAPDAFDCSGSTPSAVLDALRVAFDDADACAVYFEADLAEGQQAFSFGADTQLGNSSTSGNYYDRAALIATVENSALKQVAMIGAASEADAKESDPAFVIAPNSLTPASKFWIGYYGDREAYGSSTDTKIEGGDSGMTMSWLNVTSGGSVNFIFKVGTAEATGAIRGDSIASPTGEVTLELPAAATNIEVKVGGTALTEGTHYTVDATNPLKPVITFKPEAGLTHESVITVDVTLTGESAPQTVPITNNIPAPPAPTTHTVTFMDGMTQLDRKGITHNAAITRPPDPTKSGYTFGGWYTDAECTTAYDFSTPVTADLTLYAKWIYIPVYVHGCDSKCAVCGGCADLACPASVCAGKCRLLTMNFADVAAGEWYTEAVGYVYHHGMMEGVGSNLFGVDGITNRAMIVTILWRLEGCPAVNYLMQFEDVPAGAWYTEAVRWASAEGIVTGYAGKFNPLDAITREQLAAILYRYAQYKGCDVSVGEDTNILSYTDAFDVSEYAVPAMQWACGEGIIKGKNGALDPRGSAKRSEAAAMLMRFCQSI